MEPVPRRPRPRPLRRWSAAAAPCRDELSRRWEEATGIPITSAWGMTETSPLVDLLASRHRARRPGRGEPPGGCSAPGPNVPLTEIRLVATTAPRVARRHLPGRAPGGRARRWPRATSAPTPGADAFTDDGWLRTGDVATIDAFGYLRIVDRTKDLVKSGGEWISSVAAGERDHGAPGGAARPPWWASPTAAGASDRSPASYVVPAQSLDEQVAARAPRRAGRVVVDPGHRLRAGRDPEDRDRQDLEGGGAGDGLRPPRPGLASEGVGSPQLAASLRLRGVLNARSRRHPSTSPERRPPNSMIRRQSGGRRCRPAGGRQRRHQEDRPGAGRRAAHERELHPRWVRRDTREASNARPHGGKGGRRGRRQGDGCAGPCLQRDPTDTHGESPRRVSGRATMRSESPAAP